jgi:hypothetical protein
MADSIKVTIDGKEQEVFLAGDVVSKEEHEKIQRELEDVRMEVLTPQYDEFLKAQEAGSKTGGKSAEQIASDKAAADKSAEDMFKGMTPKQIYDKAMADAEARIDAKLASKDGETAAQESARVKREVTAFAKAHADYETYRKIMHGFALDPQYADMNIQQLYDAAKDYVKGVQAGSTPEQKKKSASSQNMKPGGDSESFSKLKSTSNEQLAQEALDETKEALGPIPLA